MKFEDALLDLQKVMNDSEGSAKQFVDQIDEMSIKYATSGAELLQGVANFKQSGFDLKEAFDLQAIASETAVAGNISVARSTELIVSALKGFKAPAKEAGRLTDIANEVSNKYATNLEELLAGMAKASPVARLMGFSFEETAKALTPIIEVYRSGTEASIAFRTGMLKLTSGSEKVKEALKDIGVKESNIQLTKGKEILEAVIKSYKDLSDGQKIFFAQQFVGIRQASRFSEVLDNASKMLSMNEVIMNSAGSRIKEFGVRYPDILCGDVGTSIRKFENGEWKFDDGWVEQVKKESPQWDAMAIREAVAGIDAMREQESEHQNQFKQSYYVQHDKKDDVLKKVGGLVQGRFDEVVVYSFDSQDGKGLLDFLPQWRSK